jgi:Na+/H+ antiporter NhaC
MTSIETAPGWAFSWCWYFFLASAVSAITAILTLVLIVTMFSELNKKGAVPLLSLYVLMLVLQSITSIVTFWMCRSSLNPERK